MLIYEKIIKKKQLAVLVDPDKNEHIEKLISFANQDFIDIFLVGGSLTKKQIDITSSRLKKSTSKPVIIFPGSVLQITEKADAILFLSLISGRNPEYLIGNHVIAARFLKESNIEVIPTGYILIEGGKTSSVEYISNTKPIPADKTDIIVSTAIAGEMLGLKMIYLEAGSGADLFVEINTIKEVKKNISVPLIVGGGIDKTEKLEKIYQAGADIVVIGTAIEKNPELVPDFYNIVQNFNSI